MPLLARIALSLLLVSTPVFAAGKSKKKPPVAKKEPPPPPPIPTEPQPKVAEEWGEKLTALVTGTTRLNTFSVNSAQAGLRPNPTLVVGGDFERVPPGRELSDANIKTFKGLIYDEKTYKLDSTPGATCNFLPELAVLAQNGTDQIELLFSFKCSALMFFTTKPGGRSVPGIQLDVKPGRKALLAFFKETMGQDAKVQALK